MKISELLEASDYKKIRDPADGWLARYTYENLDKWPGINVITTLINRYPADAGTIYRGMNFYTKEKYEEFISQFNAKNSATIEFNGITSWCRIAEDSEQFAVTQPTYFLNKEVMVAHGTMIKNRERLSGYRGVILSMVIAEKQAIDVDKSRLGHESEIILPPGKHEIAIYNTIKLYADHLTDNDTTIDQVIQHTTKDKLKSVDQEKSFFNYVIHHHSDKISDKSRQHIFNLFKPETTENLFRYSAEPYREFYKKETNQVSFDYAIVPWPLFSMYEKGIFNSPQQQRYIVKLANIIINEALPVIQQHIVNAVKFETGMISLVAKIAGKREKFFRIMKDSIGKEYRRLEGEARDINKITDPREKNAAMRAHAEKVQSLIKKIA